MELSAFEHDTKIHEKSDIDHIFKKENAYRCNFLHTEVQYIILICQFSQFLGFFFNLVEKNVS